MAVNDDVKRYLQYKMIIAIVTAICSHIMRDIITRICIQHTKDNSGLKHSEQGQYSSAK